MNSKHNPKVVESLLEGSPAYGTFLKYYGEAIMKGWARPFTAHTDKHRLVAIYTDEDVVMGGIVYGMNMLTKEGWIIFTFTVDEFRRQGVYEAMHFELDRRMLAGGMTTIGCHVHVDNLAIQAAGKKVGMQPEYIRMKKTLK